MKSFITLIWINLKLYLREPIATFFTLAFPPLMVVLFGAMYGNDPTPMLGGYGSMDVSMAGYTAMILSTVAFLGVPITISSNRESGVLRRFRTTPLRPVTYIIADILTNLVSTLIGMIGLVLVGWLLYRVRFEGQVIIIFLAVVFSGLSMFSVGYLIAGLAPGARSAQVIGMVIFYPMMFLSGSSIPLEVMPEAVQRISNFIPLTYVVRLLRGLWFGESWGEYKIETVILGVILVVCTALASHFFRWE